ncbi:MAG: TolC family protein [Chitinophagales bacterium]
MKRIFFFIACLSPVFPVTGQTVLTLQQCVQVATENNLQLKQGAAGVEFSDRASAQSKLLLLPNLNLGSSYMWNFGYTIDPVTNLPLANNFEANGYQLSAGMNLFAGGKVGNTIKKSASDLQLATMNYKNTVENIQFQVIVSFLSVMFAEEQVKISTEKINTTNAQLENSRKLAAAGSIPEGDLLSIEAQLAQDNVNLIQARNQQEKTYLDLKLLLQLPADEQVRIQYPDAAQLDAILNAPVPDAITVANYAIEHKASIQKYEYQLESDKLAMKIAAADALPTLSLFGQMSTNYSNATYPPYVTEVDPYGTQLDNNLSEVVGISLQIPIFNNGTVMINKQSAEFNYVNDQLAKEIAVNALRQNVTQAVNDLKAAIATYDASMKSYQAAKTAFEFTEKKFNIGSASAFDYTNSINTLAQAESALVQAKFDLIFKSKIIDYYLDKPLDL